MRAAGSMLEHASGVGAPDVAEHAVVRSDPLDPVTLRRVLRNAVALVFAYALPRVLTLGAVVLAARTLGTARFGAYAAAGAVAVIMSILSTAGMQPLLVREIARDRSAAPVLLRAAHRIKTLLNAVMLCALWFTAGRVFGLHGEALWAALLLGTGYAIGSYAENLAAYFQAVERMHVWTVANAAYGIVAGVAGATLILLTRSLPWFCVAMVLGHLAAVGWLFRAYRRDVPPVALSPASAAPGVQRDVRGLLRAATPFAVAFLALTIFYKGDVLILSRVQAATEAGVYVAAYKLVDVAQALMLAAIVATYPRLARAAVARGHGERWTATRLAELAVLAVAPAAGLAVLLRENIIAMLYGAEYTAAAASVLFLVPALVPLALNLLAGYVLAAADRMQLVAALYGGTAVLKLAAVTVAAARWGATGAAAVMLAAEVVLCLGLQFALHRSVHAAAGRRGLVPALVVLIAGVTAALVPGLSVTVRATLFTVIVGLAYVRLHVLLPVERDVLRAAFRLRPLQAQASAQQASP